VEKIAGIVGLFAIKTPKKPKIAIVRKGLKRLCSNRVDIVYIV
jgi:hypothetical protein